MRRESRHIWALVVVPGLLLLELFAVVLLTTDTGTAATILFTGDADLLLGVAMLLRLLLAVRKVGSGRVGRVLTAFPPALVVGELELQLLVGLGGGGDRVLPLLVSVGRGEDAEGDGDSCFKIQVDCLVWARRVVSLSTFQDRKQSQEGGKKDFLWLLPGERSRKEER